ncbi:MAG: GNAT family N-acetyltransferase [Phycisphaeraceae bacterium]|nr:GNAT family N-acetyltransferase [Phycisphaeraceae bacterium]MCW5754409.1 GNAT family N-acetyltransferase [Phycisphaeraceae bacterium]
MTRIGAPKPVTVEPAQEEPAPVMGHHPPLPEAVEPGAVTVRTARPEDVAEICRLVNAWADEGLTLRRTEADVLTRIGEFVIAHAGARAIGCGALAVFSPSLAEIRSVAVDPTIKATGVGRQIMDFLMDTAHALELDEIVLLTKVPGFFAKFGFREITPELLPAAFLEEAIAGRGRKIVGRTIMIREVY